MRGQGARSSIGMMAEQMGTLIPGAFPSRIDQRRMAQATAPILELYPLAHSLVRRHVRSWWELT